MAVRALSWVLPIVCLALALRGGVLALVAAPTALAFAAFAWWYRRFLGDYARSLAITPHGLLAVTDDYLIVHHPGVLADEVRVPWGAVRAVCVDDGDADGEGAGPAPRFVLPGMGNTANGDSTTAARPDALFSGGTLSRNRRRGIPLLAASPVEPNVVVLLDPPVDLPWHYPFIAGPFNPPIGEPWPARPWPSPGPTAAFFAAIGDPSGLSAAITAKGLLREPDYADAQYLTAEGLEVIDDGA